VPRSVACPRRALVLTAGLGTRLRPLTAVRAKGAVPVNGEPLVRRILRWLGDAGVTEAVLNLHHNPASIAATVGDGSDLGVAVRYSWEQPVLGSAGGIRRALPLLLDTSPDMFLAVNGDTLTDVDLAALARRHADSGALVTLALIPNDRPDRYGGVRLDADGYVTGFTPRGADGPSFHFVGVQACEGAAFSALEDGVAAESVNALYPALIARNRRHVAGFVSAASFRDIGAPREYLDTSLALAAAEGDRLAAGARVRVAATATVTRTILWDDVTVGEGATLTDCIVADGVRIPDHAAFASSAIIAAGLIEPGPADRVLGDLLIAPI
jgi:mannose-1-phosphate guanylyltransferase